MSLNLSHMLSFDEILERLRKITEAEIIPGRYEELYSLSRHIFSEEHSNMPQLIECAIDLYDYALIEAVKAEGKPYHDELVTLAASTVVVIRRLYYVIDKAQKEVKLD